MNPSYKSSGALEAHFGLGKHQQTNLSVTLLNGKRCEFTGIDANPFIDLDLSTKLLAVVEPPQ